jgi:hypothetical protein
MTTGLIITICENESMKENNAKNESQFAFLKQSFWTVRNFSSKFFSKRRKKEKTLTKTKVEAYPDIAHTEGLGRKKRTRTYRRPCRSFCNQTIHNPVKQS